MYDFVDLQLQSTNIKYPGPDGYPVEFYKHVWDKLGPFLLRALNENFKNKAFSASQSQGVITCIPKGDKDRKLLKNWRPISLLNSSYKLASTCIANRIKPILPYIIKTQQKGFIQGRNIADCTREIYDFLYECEENDVPGLLLLIDFQEAFDSIACDFIHLALREFDFPKTIVEWVYMMQLNPVSRVSQSGWMSDPFVLQRGCRQGDPLSPYVFILCAEFMNQAIKNSPDIVGYNIKGHEEKLTLFADDTSLFLDRSKNSLRKAISILKTYEEASGLKINVSKTKAVWVGRNRFSTDTICHEIELDWVHEFVALGVTYNVRDLQGIVQQNCVEKLAEMDRILLSWSRRNTTLVGRILIIKSLALSKLVHFFISLPSPPKDFVRELNKKFFRFLWKGKPPKIKRTTLELDFNEGGLRMVNVERFEKTMKVKWLNRMLSSNDVWKVIPETYGIDRVCRYGKNYLSTILKNIKNPFWVSMISALQQFEQIYVVDNSDSNPRHQPLWFNPDIKLPFIKKWDEMGIRWIGDIMDNNGEMKTRAMLSEEFHVNINFIDYTRLIRSVPKELILSAKDFDGDEIGPWCQQHIMAILGDNKCNQMVKKQFMLKNSIPLPSVCKWNNELLTPDDDSFWNKIFIIPKTCNRDTWMYMFQYKILHRILATNSKLFLYKIFESPLCSFCKSADETILHLYCECDMTTGVWQDIIDWLNPQGFNFEYFRDSQIILGDPKMDAVVNRILLTTKIAIFKNREKSKPPTLSQVLSMLRSQFKIERFNAETTGKLRFFRGFWAPIWNKMEKS